MFSSKFNTVRFNKPNFFNYQKYNLNNTVDRISSYPLCIIAIIFFINSI